MLLCGCHTTCALGLSHFRTLSLLICNRVIATDACTMSQAAWIRESNESQRYVGQIVNAEHTRGQSHVKDASPSKEVQPRVSSGRYQILCCPESCSEGLPRFYTAPISMPSSFSACLHHSEISKNCIHERFDRVAAVLHLH